MNILKIIANIFKKNKNTYHKKDIVWAKRYSSDIEEESIPLGHREGPYIILSEYKKQMIIINQDTLDKCVITNRVGNIITYVSLTDNKIYEHTLKNSIEFNYKIYETMDNIDFYNIIKRIEKRD